MADSHETALPAQAAAHGPAFTLHQRPIPRTGELLPAIGMGTWRTFDVADDPEGRAQAAEVLADFFQGGGRLIDSSPMYGSAEQVVGDLMPAGARPFLATKVWTRGRDEGIAQMERSMSRMRADTIDLMQIHNLIDWRTHLPTLVGWKEEGRVRYIGVTHYLVDAFPEIERIMRAEPIDFVQVPYSMGMRDAERRLLPLAQELGIAVLVMRPLEGGTLLHALRDRPLPAWAEELGCTSWAQYLLKYVLSHPAVTCPIPATRNREHLAENLRAGAGKLPTERMRKRMSSHLDA